MAKTFKTYEEALEAQGAAKEAVKDAKSALTDYYTKNKLKRTEDYTDDAKHGAKVSKLQKEIDKATDHLTDVNEQMKTLKAPKKEAKGREMKYEYPAECDTAEKRKKYRIEQRRKANGGEAKPKKEKAAKEEKSSKAKTSAKVEEKAPAKKSKTVKEEPAAEPAKKKSKFKKKKRSND